MSEVTAPPATAAPPPPALPPGPHAPGHPPQSFWLWVMCLTGVDYFSTLGYQPSIAFEATGLLTPFATVVLVFVTLCGALPVYAYVARKSPSGQGSIGMLEQLVGGWTGKVMVLVLLGFAATDFVITKTLSAADAAAHLIENPVWASALKFPHSQLAVTMILLVLLGAMFLRGSREVIGLAVVIVGVYLVMNVVVIGSGVLYLAEHPHELFDPWVAAVSSPDGRLHVHDAPFHPGGNWLAILGLCLLLFPKLALGLSGFETGVAVMPLVRGDPGDTAAEPRGRSRNTRKLLLTAALVMSVLLLGSSLVTSTLIAPEAMTTTGQAKDRALAYLAHGERLANGQYGSAVNPLFGEVFGTAYDVSTVVILWFAGASAMAGLLNLVPQYLPRYGMAPEWARAVRPLVLLFTAINLFVTWEFGASVDKQGAAYATGVLVLISSACVATIIDRYQHASGSWARRLPWGFVLIGVVFFYTTAANVIEKPDGIKIASWFILAIVISSLVSRFRRSKELRFGGFQLTGESSRLLWDAMKDLEFQVLVPHRPGARSLPSKEASIRKEHRLPPDVFIVFIEAELGDASEFMQSPLLEIRQEEGRFVIRVTRCNSIAHVIAALALEFSKAGNPPEVHFGWSDENAITANIRFLLFGEGNVPWLVRELIRRAEPDAARQPRVVVG